MCSKMSLGVNSRMRPYLTTSIETLFWTATEKTGLAVKIYSNSNKFKVFRRSNNPNRKKIDNRRLCEKRRHSQTNFIFHLKKWSLHWVRRSRRGLLVRKSNLVFVKPQVSPIYHLRLSLASKIYHLRPSLASKRNRTRTAFTREPTWWTSIEVLSRKCDNSKSLLAKQPTKHLKTKLKRKWLGNYPARADLSELASQKGWMYFLLFSHSYHYSNTHLLHK